MMQRGAWCLAAVLLFACLMAGCSWSPEAKVARHLERADGYYAEEKYREAVIEYKNVLQIDSNHVHACGRVGAAYYILGEMSQAFPYLLKAKDLDPGNLDMRMKLATVFLLGGKPGEAKKESEFILSREPKNFEALRMVANLAVTEEDLDEAVRRFNEVRADLGDRPEFMVTLGMLHLRKKDAGGAESMFRAALARDTNSVDAHMALGDLFVTRKDNAKAEVEYRAAADLAPVDSLARMKLVDFYIYTRELDKARETLLDAVAKDPEYILGMKRLADIALAQEKHEECLKWVGMLLDKDPSDAEGKVLRGRLRMAEGEVDKAITDFQEAIKARPRHAQAHYHLALAYLRKGDNLQARTNLKLAVSSAPELTDAALRLAELDLQAGSYQSAIDALETLIENQPRMVGAYILLGSAYLGRGDSGKAGSVYRRVIELAPEDPRGPYLLGLILWKEGKGQEARARFAEALKLKPDFVDPLAQLVKMDLDEKSPEAALERVESRIKVFPRNGELHYLLGKVHQARGESQEAEAAFHKAIELNPQLSDPYFALGQLYAKAGRNEQALKQLKDILKVDPNNRGALMLSGIILEGSGDFTGAREAYEKLLEANSSFHPAANNLAYLYAEHEGDLDRALKLARQAKDAAPEDPVVADTLGWILYKKGDYTWALTFLQMSASKLPENAEVRYHLGMAHYQMGNKALAKESLRAALELSQRFPGVEEAKRALAEL